MDKAPDAFRTISEVADELDIPQHVLRFWETRFSQIKPMKRSGGRRFYRPDDVDLLRGIRRLLYGEGYTIRGVQRILKEQGIKSVQALSDAARAVPSLYALDDGVKPKLPRRDEDRSGDPDDDTLASDEALAMEDPAPIPPPRRPMATPLPRLDPAPRFDVPPRLDALPFADMPRTDKSLRAEPAGDARPAADRADATPPPVAVSPPSIPDRRPLDIVRLKAVMSDLILCREMLDRALQNG